MALQDIDPQYLHETARYRSLEQLQKYFKGKQYEGMPDWWDKTVPRSERAPLIVYPIEKASVNTAVRFAIGEGKFPHLHVDEVEAGDALAPVLALSKDDAELLSKSIEDLVSRSALRTVLRTAMRRGLSVGTSVMVMSVREGRFRFEHPHAKDCIPTFANSDPEDVVESLVWSFQFDREEADKDGRPVTARYAFRRDYDATFVTEYEEAKVEPGKKIEWRAKESEAHGLGFCPVIWTRNLADDCGTDIDGVSLYDGLLDEIDALNYTLSQRHAGIDILGTPQPYETGVDDGDGPGLAGRTATPPAANARAAGAGYSRLSRRNSHRARRSGPDELWSYSGQNVKVDLLETTGKAFEVASAHVQDVRSRLLEAMDIILLDPTTVAGKSDLSAKALALMFAPLLALVDELREWWWEHSISRALEMMLRAVSVLGEGVLVRGAAKLVALLQKRSVTVDGAAMWQRPEIKPLWGEYFAPGADEILANVQSAGQAKTAGLISNEAGVRYVANHFAIGDIDTELEQIASDKDDAQQRAMDAAAAAGAAVGASAGPPGLNKKKPPIPGAQDNASAK